MEAPEQTDPTPISEEATQSNPQPEQPAEQIPEFVRLVLAMLEARSIKPRCPSCSAIGWASFELIPFPVVNPTMAQGQIVLSACSICKKCAAMTYRNLNLLGIEIKMPEQSRILTPNGPAPQKPLIVTG